MEFQGLTTDHKQYSLNLDSLAFKWKQSLEQRKPPMPPNHKVSASYKTTGYKSETLDQKKYQKLHSKEVIWQQRDKSKSNQLFARVRGRVRDGRKKCTDL